MAPSDPPAPYAVDYSDLVRQRLRVLAREAFERGDGPAFAAALKEFHRRLTVYPQFGDPLFDLKHERGHIRIGIIRPLAMRYGVHEDRRLVFVGAPPVLLPMARPDAEAD
jgi:hypothetical protein